MPAPRCDADVAVIGAGAAGLATAIFTRRRALGLRVLVLDSARQPGAKILVSGGSRCNVTNTVVTASDFNSENPPIVRRVLKALPVEATVAFFREIGVPLVPEAHGKLFPASGRSRDVLDALLRELARCGAELRSGHRVVELSREGETFRIVTSQGPLTATRVVLATGGLSLPKTGSDGWGYDAARQLGHSIVATSPALVPLLIDSKETDARHRFPSGVAHPARLDLRVDDRVVTSVKGALLWTHFGISGPAALDISRHWLRAPGDDGHVKLTVSFAPGDSFESLERQWIALGRNRPRLGLATALAGDLPASVAAAVLAGLDLPGSVTLAEFPRESRRRLVHGLLAWPLAVTGSRGYSYAEVTAGGVPLSEIDPATMESRVCPGLSLVGEILDVDGRIGGFNFQWGWASASVAASALADIG